LGDLATPPDHPISIGKAFAFHFAHEGYNIIATGTRAALLQNTVKELTNKFDIEATAFEGDLSDVSIQDKLIAFGKEKQAVVLVNNAGFALNKLFYEADLDNWLQMNELHITCISGISTKMLILLTSCIPKALYYRLVNSIFR